MKRLFLFFLFLFLIISFTHATVYFGSDENIRLDFAPISPLYKESIAYPFSTNVRFYYMMAPERDSSVTNSILVSAADTSGEPTYIEKEFKDFNLNNRKYWGLKSCVNLGLLRFSFGDDIRKTVAAEVYIHGGINTVFGAYGGVDCLGFDGQYGLGIAAQFLESISMRFGFHHFSGHWGDEILEDFYSKGYVEGTDYKAITEFTRNNSWYFGVSYEAFNTVRIAVDVELPERKAWIRPAAHVPANTAKPSSEESPEAANTASHIWAQEGFDGRNNYGYPASYKGWRIGLSLEAQYKLKNIGRAYVGIDWQLHQDGKIDIATANYDQALPWKQEFTAVAGISLRDRTDLPEFNIEFSYHTGRFPLLNYWFKEIEYFSFGIGVTL